MRRTGYRPRLPVIYCQKTIRRHVSTAANPGPTRHRHTKAALVVVDFLDRAVEIIEWTVGDPHQLTRLEQHLGLGLVDPLGHSIDDGVGFLLADRGGLVLLATDETHHLGHILDQVPAVLVHLHLDQHVAGKELALTLALDAFFHLDHFFGRDQNLAKQVLHAGARNAFLQRTLNLLLEAGISVHDVPALCHQRPPPRPISQRTMPPKARSNSARMMATMIVTMITTIVVWKVSWRVGQTTLRRSTSASRM